MKSEAACWCVCGRLTRQNNTSRVRGAHCLCLCVRCPDLCADAFLVVEVSAQTFAHPPTPEEDQLALGIVCVARRGLVGETPTFLHTDLTWRATPAVSGQ